MKQLVEGDEIWFGFGHGMVWYSDWSSFARSALAVMHTIV
jgi:hypothetical protein